MLSTICFFPLVIASLEAQNVGIGTSAPLEKLHVAGNVRVDPLAGSANRVTIANPQGTFQVVPVGNNGEILTQHPSGPQWQPLPNSSASSVSNCATPPCPSTLSATSAASMSWGTCSRYCETLVDLGFSDWRLPSLEEVVYLFPTSITENVRIWTNTIEEGTSVRWIGIKMDTGKLAALDGDDVVNGKCKCVR